MLRMSQGGLPRRAMTPTPEGRRIVERPKNGKTFKVGQAVCLIAEMEKKKFLKWWFNLKM